MGIFTITTQTLRLRRPFGKTLGFAVVILIILVGLCEGIARINFIQRFLPMQSIGSGHVTIDVKLSRLNTFVKKEGRVDCFFLGSSMVYRAINPEVFQDAYKSHTGKDILCFNFALGGVSELSTSALSEILIKLYQPKLLIIGTSPLNLREHAGLGTAKKILNNPWIKYHLGFFSINGWLIDNSFAFRHYVGFRTLLNPLARSKEQKKELEMTAYGFGGRRADKKHAAPRITIKAPQELEDVKDYENSQSNLAAIEQIMQLKNQATILFIEMPCHQSAFSLFRRGEEDYDRGIGMIDNAAKRYGVQFWHTMPFNFMSDEGWNDSRHMSSVGAEIFSRWLGETVGKAVKQGTLGDPTR